MDHKYSHNTTCATIVNFELSIVLNYSRVDLKHRDVGSSVVYLDVIDQSTSPPESVFERNR